ncbi:unnamed protein product [Symbiodinium sp. CCMP2592]|nr:unnamed protein product [Symbiodinium sp. CCMP2592]CAE7722271.1 unnamed protein product [Symbiodinium sp. CCMP2592]
MEEKLAAEIARIMDNTEVQPNRKLDRLVNFLKESQLAYTTTLRPAELLHAQSAGCFNSKGQKLLDLGFRPSLLTDSIAIELSPLEDKRNEQIRANTDLSERSNGLLSPVLGSERAMTVSSSHTTAYLKASLMKCKRPNSGGSLSLEDECMRDAVNQGWPWLLISWRAEAMAPNLPAFVQMVLNSVHSVGLACQEIEAAQQVALMCTSGSTVKDAVNSVKASKPACEDYMEHVGVYVQKFGGGSPFPLISFLASFAKDLALTVAVGEETFKAITAWDLQEPSTQFPLLRAALLACQLTSPKVVDGTARLLVKQDLDRLKSAQHRQALLQAEQILEHGYQVYRDAGETPAVQRALGRMMVRLSLLLTKKEKYGREKVMYESQEKVAQLFATEALNTNPSGASSAGGSEADENREEDRPLNLLGGMSVGEQALLQNPHLKKDGKYVHADYPDKIFVFAGLENDEAKFVHTPLFASPDIVMTSPEHFKKWKVTRLPVPSVLAADESVKFTYGGSAVLNDAKILADGQQQLFQIFADQNTGDSSCLHFIHPTAEKLRLIPLANMTRAKEGQKLSLWVEWNGNKYQLSPFPQLKDFGEQPKKTDTIVPFYWIKTTSSEEEVNMVVQWKTVAGMKLPMLVNNKKVAKHTMLMQASKELLQKQEKEKGSLKRKAT